MAIYEDNITHYDDEKNQAILSKATLLRRFFAFSIDHTIFITILTMPFMLFVSNSTQENGDLIVSMFPILMIIAFFVYCLKDIVNGRSLGKYLLGIAVRNSSNSMEKPPASKLILRNVFTFVWPIEFIALAFSKKKMKFGDQIADTDVFYVSKKNNTLGIIVAAILTVAVCSGTLIFGISTILKNDDSYKAAIRFIEADPEIVALVGDIKGYGFIPTGDLIYYGSHGEAIYSIKVIGSKRVIFVNLRLEKQPGGNWEILAHTYRN